MATEVSIATSSEPPTLVIYIQATCKHGKDGKAVTKWYKITDSDIHKCSDDDDMQITCDLHRSFSSQFVKSLSCGKILSPIFDGPPNGLGGCGCVALGSKLYLCGGVEYGEYLSKEKPKFDRDIGDFVTNKVYCRDFSNPDPDCEWDECPSMIKHRSWFQAAFVDGRMYAFGSGIRMWEGVEQFDDKWSPWAEYLDLLPSPTLNCGEWKPIRDPISYRGEEAIAYAILEQGKKILMYFKSPQRLLSYDIKHDCWTPRITNNPVGRFYEATFMDEVLYGAGAPCMGPDLAVYAFDIKSRNSRPRSVIKCGKFPVLPSGLIPVGKDVLYVVTGVQNRRDNFHIICCSKYRISKKDREVTGELIITAEPLSTSNYYLKDVIGVHNFIAMPPFELRDDRYTAVSQCTSGLKDCIFQEGKKGESKK